LLVRNVVAVVLGVISGLILIYTGTVGSIGVWAYLPLILAALGLPPAVEAVVSMLLGLLNWLAAMGGLTVLLGCLLVLLGRHRTGAWVMSIGAGMSIMSLAWTLLQMWMTGNLTLAALLGHRQFTGWAGAFLSVFAQEMVKIPAPKPRPPQAEKESAEGEPESSAGSGEGAGAAGEPLSS